jgi:hypothetical protein
LHSGLTARDGGNADIAGANYLSFPHLLADLMGYMMFIVIRLAIDSKAGKEGLFVLVLGLMVGVLGFLLKLVIQWSVETIL